MRFIEYPPSVVDDQFDEIPKSGDTIWCGDQECVVVKSNIVNEVKLQLQVMRKREVKVFDDFEDYSVGWDEESEVINEFLRKKDVLTSDDIE